MKTRVKGMTPEAAIVATSVLMVAVVAGASHFADNGMGIAVGMAFGFALLGLSCLRMSRTSKPLLGLSLIGQAIAMTAAFSGHAWQIDSHMSFFAFLAVLVSLRDVPTIVVATVAIALHHLSLTFWLPALVYPSTDLLLNFERTVFHAIIVLAESGVLIVSIRVINELWVENDRRMADRARVQAEAERARDDALGAKAEADQNRASAEVAQRTAEKALLEVRTQKDEADAANQRALDEEANKKEVSAAHQRELQQVISALGSGLKALANKQLDVRLTTPFPAKYDDLRESLNSTADALHRALQQVAGEAHQMLDESTSIETGLRDLADIVGRHVAHVEKASHDMKEVAAGVHDAATNASEMSANALSAKESAERSGEVVERASAAMAEIDKSASEINTIISVIEQIAFQTNLLALNAGVEAARAGDAGRGFAVVASEVRALARRSSEAASDISDLINNSQAQVKNGVQYVAETVNTLATVKEAVLQVSAGIHELSATARQQANAIGDINGSIQEIESSTRANASSMDTIAKAAGDLTRVAGDVMQLAGEFTRETAGTRARKPAAA